MKNRVVCLAAVLVASSVAIAQGPPPARVRLGDVKQESIERHRQVTGQLRASQSTRAASREEGRVETMLVDVGDLVRAGQPMVELDTTLVMLDLAEIDADLEALRRTVDEIEALQDKAVLDVKRLERAVAEGGVSPTELEDAQTRLAAAKARSAKAEADVAARQAERDRVNQRIKDMVVLAPFSGSVVAKLTEVGEWVDQGDAVAEIVQLDPIDAWLEVPERYIDDLQHGAAVTVRVDSVDVSVDSTDVAIVAQANELARTFPVRVRVSNPTGALKPGMSASAEMATGDSATAVTIPKDALLRDDAGTYVYFDAGGVAMPARVDRLWGVGDRVVIRSDTLRPGMRVVVEGNERLFPSQPLMDIDAPPPAPTTTSQADDPNREGR